MTDDEKKMLDDFRASLSEELFKRFQTGSVSKEGMQEILTKQIESAGLKMPDSKVTSETLWQSMSRLDRFLWHLFRRWPLKRIADDVRSKIDILNDDVRALQERIEELDEDGFGIGFPVKYPPVLEPDPKRILLCKWPVMTPIESVSVQVTIPREDVDKGDSEH